MIDEILVRTKNRAGENTSHERRVVMFVGGKKEHQQPTKKILS